VVVAHSFLDRAKARQIALAVEQDWAAVPASCRQTYEEVLGKSPDLVIVQLRRKNVCGCLGHRHLLVRETPFAEPHEAFAGASIGELDIAYELVEEWQPLPLRDTALGVKFPTGTRSKEFYAQQFRLQALSTLLHEINHLAFPREPEASVRKRSLGFYREAFASYAERAVGSLSLTIVRSFSAEDASPRC